ncbi:Ferrous iron transport protein A [Planctomycetes bacterium Pan216]|uniref:Ferrous iron transport protein A n=1 Tax=Kolteria novifilia TaxID=2527975 RepID=A0A518AX34_9BACT|nr:Ferrous iron transport protein A [Planctomycetes bacterium Pan216]
MSANESEVVDQLSLDTLNIGDRATIESLEGSDAVSQRLMEMGLLEGSDVEVLAFAPLGDPIEIKIRGYQLSLRRTEAARILVRRL